MRFDVGEKGTCLIACKGIPVGTVTSTIKDLIVYEGRDICVIELAARTNKFLSKKAKTSKKEKFSSKRKIHKRISKIVS